MKASAVREVVRQRDEWRAAVRRLLDVHELIWQKCHVCDDPATWSSPPIPEPGTAGVIYGFCPAHRIEPGADYLLYKSAYEEAPDV